MDAHQQELVAHFCGVTGANASQAQTALASADWDLEEAVSLYFAANEPAEPENDEQDIPAPASHPTPSQPTASSAASGSHKPPGQQGKMRTLRDLQGVNDDDDDDDETPNLYAGGDKSGLAVQDPSNQGPRDHFNNIMRQARENRDRPPGEGDEDEPQRSSHFSGRAQTLGGEGTESQVVEDPAAAAASRRGQRSAAPPRVTRTLHLWDDGVSVDDGDLYRFDDPANATIMSQINQGQAPLSMLDVQPGQEVDLNLIPHKGEKFVKPKPKYKPFGGSGQRLGSPTPGAGPSSSSTTAPPASAPASSSATTQPKTTEMPVDSSMPTLTLQIRLGDGTRLQSRFNTTHTIGDVYSFVDRAASTTRPYALMTTFPSKELADKSQVLGEMSDFKRGGVVVQKWT